MPQDDIRSYISALEQQIEALPKGSVTTKKINGKTYYYHRQMIDKKRVEKYIPADEVEQLRMQIEQRKALETECRKIRRIMTYQTKLEALRSDSDTHDFVTSVMTGKSLRPFADPIHKFKKRNCFQKLHDYIYGEAQDRVFILYGLRRTGKTTLIRQILDEMSDDMLDKTAFIQLTAKNTLADVNKDLRYLKDHGYHTIFLDEITLMEDFIEGAALLSDVFAVCGMKLVLSGTDSLGFLFSEDEQLYDRCVMLHTTFIPYREFESVLGICGIDEYIRYGGTMSLGGMHYNKDSTFATKERVGAYVDTAIAHNIQHSLRCYQYEGHFRHLQALYEKDELTSAINRVVEDMNHRFTLEVLTRDFKSHDLALSAKNLRKDRSRPTDILDSIDVVSVTDRLRRLLEIRNREEQSVVISEEAAAEIREYLRLLDLIHEMDVVSLANLNKKAFRTVIAQPGLRYAQADALIESLLLDETFADLSLPERNTVCDRIRDEIRGRMLEDMILLETKLANPEKEVFTLQFPIGEFDMVIFDPAAGNCGIFEIKHSTRVEPHQYRHLIDADKCAQTQHRYGTITARTVLYRGESRMADDIRYLNVEEYLRTLGEDK